MATVKSKTLFLTTSPRSPEKMIPEIELLFRNFNGQVWNTSTQTHFMEILREEQFFNGQGANNPAFSARDRINRGPKSLGFVTLSPVVELTSAGKKFIESQRKEDVFLRQLLKFQIPSPYHKPTTEAAHFCVKPYLELLRLIRTLGTLKFDELQIFGMQLTDWHDFDKIVQKIKDFRKGKEKNKGRYSSFKSDCIRQELARIYVDRISKNDFKTRENSTVSMGNFLRVQISNMRDYADAAFRYLRFTGLVSVSHVGKSLSIIEEKIEDVDFILNNIERNPYSTDDIVKYSSYLGDSVEPVLLSDNRDFIIKKIRKHFPLVSFDETAETETLKNLLFELLEKRKQSTLDQQITDIKNYSLYENIQETYQQILENKVYDAPLMFEWNTWRAMTMIDGGNIKANLKFDDFGAPICTAQGNMSDIICDYGDFYLLVEVTLATGQRQYVMEGEPVSRHLGQMKKNTDKPCYCLFIAPIINEACIAHFYLLHSLNVSYYGGTSTILPLPLKIFQQMLEKSHQANYIPNPEQIRRLFNFSESAAAKSEDENQWYAMIQDAANHWLNASVNDNPHIE